MRSQLVCFFFGTLCLGLLLAASAPAEDEPPPPPPEDVAPPPGIDVQAQGLVHEAFAEPMGTGLPQASPVVPKAPPAPVEEAPPDEKPEGDGVFWVPGYWSYDDARADFVWVSGFWRVAPPGRQWTPGAWQAVAGGYQWTAGYWAEPGSTEEQYLPPPPPPVPEAGPSIPAPQPTSTYVPGLYVWRDTRYLWRPGYWVPYRPDWVWTPSYYQRTPVGYLYVSGFWDRPFHRRGLLFAPVRFQRGVLGPRFVYRPSFVVQPDFLLGALFVRTTTRRFYFGDYFDNRFVRSNYVPWVDYRPTRFTYDGNYSYYRFTYAGHPEWDRGLRQLYTGRYNGTVARPPQTLVQQRVALNVIAGKRTGNVMVSKSVNITNVQNVAALAPVGRLKSVQVTGLTSLGRLKTAQVRALPVQQQVRMERVSKTTLVQQQKAITHYTAVAKERVAVQQKLIVKGPPPAGATVVHRATIESFRTAPPHIVHTTTKAPAAPVRPKEVVRPIPKK